MSGSNVSQYGSSHRKTIAHLLVLFILGFLLYSNVLQGEFISDDHLMIADNPAVRDFRNIAYLWESFNTRILVGFSFALNYYWGGLNVFGYHIVNILIHIFASWLVYWFVLLTAETPHIKGSSLYSQKKSLAFLSALIFLCHPVQTQGVSFITQRAISLGTTFYLLTLIFYIRARFEKRKLFKIIAFFFLFLGMFTKEMILTAPVTLLFYEWIFLRGNGKLEWKRFAHVWPYFSAMLILPSILLFNKLGSALGLKFQLTHGGFSWNYFFTVINVLRTYLRMFILPVNLVHDYDYPISQGFFEWPTVLSVMLLLVLVFLAYKLFFRKRWLSFCIGWFFITTSVELGVVTIVHRGMLYDHWLYLPMVGFAMFLSILLHEVAKDKAGLKGLSFVIILIFSLMTYQRNFVWQNEVLFWHDVIKKSPNMPGAYLAAGNAYDRIGEKQKGFEMYKRSVEVNPEFVRGLNNLGVRHLKKGEYDKAMSYFHKILKVNNRFAKAYNNLAYVHFLKKDFSETIELYERSLEYQAPYPRAYFYMAQAYNELGEKEKAISFLKKAVLLFKKQKEWSWVKDSEDLLKQLSGE